MTYKQKKQAIVQDYNKGLSIEEIAQKYSYSIKNVEVLIKLKKYQTNPDFFNVDENDCWIVPSISDKIYEKN